VTPTEPPERRAQLASALAAVRARIAAACSAAGRAADEVTLVAVTKTYPAADIVLLADLGVTDVGENRDQEAAGKAAAVRAAQLQAAAAQVEAARFEEVGTGVRWHFVGQLQRNKARSVVGYADVVQSVDSVRLATALGTAASRLRDRPLDVLVQVSIDGDPHRGGALADPGADAGRALPAVAEAVADSPALRLRGVMAVAPLTWNADDAFARLAEIAADLRSTHPEATLLSAGMSADLEPAIAHGATHVRIGSALLGKRAPLG
jgi:pyridoxal phosphate enzyme (YggS family)